MLLLVSLLWRDPDFRQTLRYTLQGIALLPIFYYIVSSPNVWQTRWLSLETAVLARVGLLHRIPGASRHLGQAANLYNLA